MSFKHKETIIPNSFRTKQSLTRIVQLNYFTQPKFVTNNVETKVATKNAT